LTSWKLVKETEHGKLFRSPKGSFKIRIKCNQCGVPIESAAKSSDRVKIHFFHDYLEVGNPYAVCSSCDSLSKWRPAR